MVKPRFVEPKLRVRFSLATHDMQKLFAYGTLRDHSVQQQLIKRVLTGVPDILTKHRATLACSEGKLFLDIAQGNEAVYGDVFEISDEELLAFDTYEGENYIRYQVTLESGTVAWVYDNVTV